MGSLSKRVRRAAFVAAGLAAVACAVCAAVFASRPPYDVVRVRLDHDGFSRAGVVYHPRRWFRRRHPGILFCHGMLREGKDTALYARLMHKLARRGYLVACFDMPGFGDSFDPGEPFDAAPLDLVGGVEAAITWVLAELPVEKGTLTVAGHSCGANPAFAAGVRDRRVANVVVLSAGNFTPAAGSDPAAAKVFVDRWWLETGRELPVGEAMRIGKSLDVFRYLPVEPPKSVLVGAAADEHSWVLRHNRKLHDALDVEKEFLLVSRSGHNLGFDEETGDILLDPAPSAFVAEAIDDWLSRRGRGE